MTIELTGKSVTYDFPGKSIIDLAGFSIFSDLAGKRMIDFNRICNEVRNY